MEIETIDTALLRTTVERRMRERESLINEMADIAVQANVAQHLGELVQNAALRQIEAKARKVLGELSDG